MERAVGERKGADLRWIGVHPGTPAHIKSVKGDLQRGHKEREEEKVTFNSARRR